MKNTNRVLLKNKERNLLLKSNICNKNVTLKNILQCYPSIKPNDLINIKKIDSNSYKILKTNDAIQSIIEQASLEWEQEKPCGIEQSPCELCGNTKSKYKFIIHNKLNDNRMKVGSDCIGHFPKLDKKYKGVSIASINRLYRTNSKKLERIIKFNERFEDGKDIFNKWIKEYNSFDIIFPKDYDEDIKYIITNAKKIYNNYINSRVGDEALDKFKNMIFEFNYLYNKCKRFYSENKFDEYICTPKIASTLNNDKFLEHIKNNNGKIPKSFAKYIHDLDFISRFEDKIIIMFGSIGFKVYPIEQYGIKLEYYKFNKYILKFYISLDSFAWTFSDIFYDKNSLNKEQVFKHISLVKNDENVHEFIDIIKYILKDTKYSVYYNSNKYGLEITEVYISTLNRFTTININELITGEYDYILYSNKDYGKRFILEKIKNKTWKDKKEQHKYDV